MLSLVSLTLQDGSTLERIHAACFPDAWEKEAFDRFLSATVTCGWMAIMEGGEPVGFILAQQVEGEAEILTFAVHPSFQRRGIGRRLVEELLNFLLSTKCQKVFLEVAIDNESAIALYTSVGFAIVGTRPNYYQRIGLPPVAASLMAWVKEGAQSHQATFSSKGI